MQILNLASKPSLTSALILKLYLISACATASVSAAPNQKMWKAWSVGIGVVEEGLAFTFLCLPHAAVAIYTSLLCMHRTAPCSVFVGQDEVQVASVAHACESQLSLELVSLICDIHSAGCLWGQPKALHRLITWSLVTNNTTWAALRHCSGCSLWTMTMKLQIQ